MNTSTAFFNTSEAPPADSFDAIPAGDYMLQALEANLVQTKAGNNMLKVQFEVVDGPFENRKIFEQFNIDHQNPQVVEIAQRDLTAWIQACGIEGDVDVSMDLIDHLCGKEFLAAVKIEKDKSGHYDDQNRIKRYKAPAAARAPAPEPAAGGAPPATPPAAAAAAPVKRPWEK